MEVRNPVVAPVKVMVFLSTLALLAGAGGMAISFLFLASQNHLDVIAGATGFLSGVVLVAVGLLSLSIQSRTAATSQTAVRIVRSMIGLLPPATAVLSWPILYFGAGLAMMMFIPVVLLGCVIWAGLISRTVANDLAALLGTTRVRVLWGMVFTAQLVVILVSWPLFDWFLGLIASMGYKVGWS
jgi:hypothetical protein